LAGNSILDSTLGANRFEMLAATLLGCLELRYATMRGNCLRIQSMKTTYYHVCEIIFATSHSQPGRLRLKLW